MGRFGRASRFLRLIYVSRNSSYSFVPLPLHFSNFSFISSFFFNSFSPRAFHLSIRLSILFIRYTFKFHIYFHSLKQKTITFFANILLFMLKRIINQLDATIYAKVENEISQKKWKIGAYCSGCIYVHSSQAMANLTLNVCDPLIIFP